MSTPQRRIGPASEYHVDADDRIVYVSPAFLAFAIENGAPELNASSLLGVSIWDCVAGVSTREIYAVAFDLVRQERRALSLPIRCDSPTCRRFMELEIVPGAGRVLELRALLLRAEPRPAEELLDPRRARSDVILEACSFCRDIYVGNSAWMGVEDAVRHMDLFSSAQLPLLSHSVCPRCLPEFHRRMGFSV